MDLNCKYIVVGAGFFGAVIAERIANVLNEKVLVIDKRNHIGGNSYSEVNPETGIEVHKYGSHIFHTNNKEVWDYLNRFSGFNHYKHKVITNYQGKLYPMPVNRQTINQFYGLNLTENEVFPFLEKEALKEKVHSIDNFEEKAISQVGRKLYEAFFRGYTLKQWQTDPKLLPASTFNRLPVRNNDNDYYFDDPYQGIPLLGYGEIFKKMLKHPNIEIKLSTDFFDIKEKIPKNSTVIYSGPIDHYFNFEFGELGWRTLDFQQEIISNDSFQGTTVVNYAEEKIPFTRIHEFKFYHPERTHQSNKTIIFKEFSRTAKRQDTPYYPINTAEDKKRFELYEAKMKAEKNVIFGGRLGQYKYFDMHHVIALALKTFESKINPCKA